MYGADAHQAGTRPDFRRPAPVQKLEFRSEQNKNTGRSDRNRIRLQSYLSARTAVETKPLPQKAELPRPLPDYKAVKNTPPIDEPLYDMGFVGASFPVVERFCTNYDFGGFIPLVERTYEALRNIDDRLLFQMPYAMFLHHCVVYLNSAFIDCAIEQGARPFGTSTKTVDLLTSGGDYIIPEVIKEYVVSITKSTTPNGEDVYVNVPEISIPRAAGVGFEAGFFGPCTHINHNVYEAYVSPAITARRVLAQRDNQVNWVPIPNALNPDRGVPTPNLLGYGALQNLDAIGRSRLNGIEFSNANDATGRLKFNAELTSRVNTYLLGVKTKFKSLSITGITPQGSPVNAVFVETLVAPDGPAVEPLSYAAVEICGFGPFSSSVANHSYLAVPHRRRTATARGFCLTRQDGFALPNWQATINRNFEMLEPFNPVLFSDLPELRTLHHIVRNGTPKRIVPLDGWVRRVSYLTP